MKSVRVISLSYVKSVRLLFRFLLITDVILTVIILPVGYKCVKPISQVHKYTIKRAGRSLAELLASFIVVVKGF